jgi:hypothetical protein
MHFDLKGWKGVTPEENQKRSKLVAQDMSMDKKHSSAAASQPSIRLILEERMQTSFGMPIYYLLGARTYPIRI